MAKPPLGTGERFSQLKSQLASRPGVRNPGALAAYIGRKKYGGEKMASMAAKGAAHGHGSGPIPPHGSPNPSGNIATHGVYDDRQSFVAEDMRMRGRAHGRGRGAIAPQPAGSDRMQNIAERGGHLAEHAVYENTKPQSDIIDHRIGAAHGHGSGPIHPQSNAHRKAPDGPNIGDEHHSHHPNMHRSHPDHHYLNRHNG